LKENIDNQIWYHGTNAAFDKFDLKFFGKTDEGWYGKGVYFHSDEGTADAYGKNIIKVKLNYEKPPLILPLENSNEYLYDTLEEYNEDMIYLPKEYKSFSVMKIIRLIGKEEFSNFIKQFHDAMIINYVQGTSQAVVFNSNIIEIIKDEFVNCSQCGWSWKLKDGGDKPYLCHKCGHDNSKTALTERCWKGYTQKGTKINNIIKEYLSTFLSEGVNYFKDKTNVHDYDKVFNKKNAELPKEYKNWEAKREDMTMEKYFEECAKFQNSTYDHQINLLWQPKVDYIATKMKEGVKYDMPYLNYVNKTQEGRHRVAAAAELGQEIIPVMVLKIPQKAHKEEAGDISYKLGEWNDLVQMGSKYYCVFEGTDLNAEHQLLRLMVSGYDEYYLDHLFDIRMGKPFSKSIGDFLKYEKKNYNKFKNFDEFLQAYAIMKNNENAIYDAIEIKNNNLLLKVLTDRIQEDYSDYSSCKEMLEDIRYKEYYVNEYSLKNEETEFEIPSNYIKEAKKLFQES
jgi:hypothetical protein